MKTLTVRNALKGATLAAASLLSITTAKAANDNNNGNDFNAVIGLTEPATEAGIDWNFTHSSDFTVVGTSFLPEYASVWGTVPGKLPGDEDNNSNGVDPTVHYGLLLESDGTTVSDILKLTVINPKSASGNDTLTSASITPVTASVKFEMWSDGNADFNSILAGLDTANLPKMKETGDLQSVGDGFLFNDNSRKLVINVSSDVETGDPNLPPEGTPNGLPDGGATMLLLGGGVSALALLRRKL